MRFGIEIEDRVNLLKYIHNYTFLAQTVTWELRFSQWCLWSVLSSGMWCCVVCWVNRYWYFGGTWYLHHRVKRFMYCDD